MDNSELRTLRDFLYLYNKISENCFRKCVYNMTKRTLDTEEADCINTCVHKHMNVNHKTMECFAEINPIFQQKKLEEYQKDLQKHQEQQEAAAQKSMTDSTTPTATVTQ